MYQDYSPKGVKFFYLYKKLQHPGFYNYVDPLTIEERLKHLKVAKQKLGTEFTWICDTMENDVRDALGRLPNSEIVIDPDGKIVLARAWSNPTQLRTDLEELVGKSETTTEVSDLEIEQQKLGFDLEVAEGVVEPMKINEPMANIQSAAAPSEDPYFVKLHVQANSGLLREGKGRLYFAFRLDPIYDVHWNNQVAPLEYELTASDGSTISAATGESPKVEAKADLDPREFLVDIEGATDDTELTLKVKYSACTDEWCRPFTQEYTIRLERDRANQLARPRAGRRR